MDICSQFIARYKKEFDFFEQACRISAQLLDTHLQSAGVRAIVTSRAKNPQRLETKIRQRNIEKKYDSVEAIFQDIVDLAGIRVALYFPGEREDVGRIIQSLFQVIGDPKVFPSTSTQPSPHPYSKRFSGYHAIHYRVTILDSHLNESQKRYADANIEIQVASVLMHAWSEVEHDLVYKPLQGSLSQDEYAILDELNGMVLSGEIALERLQRAAETRLSNHGTDQYTNHYDVASSLLNMARAKLGNLALGDSTIGRVDILFELLKKVSLNTPEHLSRYVDSLHADLERRPLTDQIIDQILDEEPSRFDAYLQIKESESQPTASIDIGDIHRSDYASNSGRFLRKWVELDILIKNKARSKNIVVKPTTSLILLKKLNIGDDIINVYLSLRHLRNAIVHGLHHPNDTDIDSKTVLVEALIKHLSTIEPNPKPAAIGNQVVKSARVRKAVPKKKMGSDSLK